MADRKLACEVVTPDKVVFSGEVDMVVAPGADGEVGILPLHTPYLTMLKIGELRVRFDKEGRTVDDYIAVHGGFLEVFEDRVTVLASAAEMAREIDVERAKQAHERAKTLLGKQEGVDQARADASLMRARTRIKASGRPRH